MGFGAAASSESVALGLMVSKMLACFTRAKLLKISAFLLKAVCAATALLESGIAPVVRRCSGKTNRSRPLSNRSRATSVYCTRNILARTIETSMGVTPCPRMVSRGSKFSGREISSVSPELGCSVIGPHWFVQIEYVNCIARSKPDGFPEWNRRMPHKSFVFNTNLRSGPILTGLWGPVSSHKRPMIDSFCQSFWNPGSWQRVGVGADFQGLAFPFDRATHYPALL